MATTREVPLTKGKVALVDEGDYEKVAARKWQASYYNGIWYARCSVYQFGAKYALFMHRVILDAPAGAEVDHKDGNGLNNRRSNLRLATSRNQKCNVGIRKDNTSGYKGVTRSGGKWKAYIKHSGKVAHLGMASTPEAAARIYDAKARELYGEFAWFNFPEEGRTQNGNQNR